MKKKYFYFTAVVIVSVFFFGGIFIGRQLAPKNSFYKIHDTDKNYPFINPLLGIKVTEQSDLYQPLKEKISDYIEEQKLSGRIHDIAFYLRDLNTANWTGVNEDMQFIPGSLSKVLLMISYFKLAESNADVLNQKLYYDGSFDLNTFEYFKPKNPISPQKSYTVKNLIEFMVSDSGNNSAYLLTNNFDADFFNKIAASLKIEFPDAQNFQDFMSPRMYSLVFRVLYNSTYLSRPMSNEALRILSQSTFKYGLEAGIPKNIIVAHKFGEHFLQLKELHDCGIVYKSNSPYFICVMTKGDDFDIQAKAIAEISKMAYEEMQ